MQTIEKRINGLGLTEPTMQQRGRAEAELRDAGAAAWRGRSGSREGDHADRGHARDHEVKDGPFPSRRPRWPSMAACCRSDTKMLPMSARGDRGESGGWYLVSPYPGDHGPRSARARPAQDRDRASGRRVLADAGRRPAVRPIHRRPISETGWRSCWTTRSRALRRSRRGSRDSGRITGWQSAGSFGLALVLRAGSLPAGVVYEEERRSVRRSAPTPSGKVSWPVWRA